MPTLGQEKKVTSTHFSRISSHESYRECVLLDHATSWKIAKSTISSRSACSGRRVADTFNVSRTSARKLRRCLFESTFMRHRYETRHQVPPLINVLRNSPRRSFREKPRRKKIPATRRRRKASASTYRALRNLLEIACANNTRSSCVPTSHVLASYDFPNHKLRERGLLGPVHRVQGFDLGFFVQPGHLTQLFS